MVGLKKFVLIYIYVIKLCVLLAMVGFVKIWRATVGSFLKRAVDVRSAKHGVDIAVPARGIEAYLKVGEGETFAWSWDLNKGVWVPSWNSFMRVFHKLNVLNYIDTKHRTFFSILKRVAVLQLSFPTNDFNAFMALRLLVSLCPLKNIIKIVRLCPLETYHLVTQVIQRPLVLINH
jgi:hypothetical protein